MSQADVVVALKEHGPMTRIEISKRTGINPFTLASTLKVMKRNGTVESEPAPKEGKSIPPHIYRLKKVVERQK